MTLGKGRLSNNSTRFARYDKGVGVVFIHNDVSVKGFLIGRISGR
jgi:hypothetical protein